MRMFIVDDSNKLFYFPEKVKLPDSYFLYDCRNCSRLYLVCTNLRNKILLYFKIFNIQKRNI